MLISVSLRWVDVVAAAMVFILNMWILPPACYARMTAEEDESRIAAEVQQHISRMLYADTLMYTDEVPLGNGGQSAGVDYLVGQIHAMGALKCKTGIHTGRCDVPCHSRSLETAADTRRVPVNLSSRDRLLLRLR